MAEVYARLNSVILVDDGDGVFNIHGGSDKVLDASSHVPMTTTQALHAEPLLEQQLFIVTKDSNPSAITHSVLTARTTPQITNLAKPQTTNRFSFRTVGIGGALVLLGWIGYETLRSKPEIVIDEDALIYTPKEDGSFIILAEAESVDTDGGVEDEGSVTGTSAENVEDADDMDDITQDIDPLDDTDELEPIRVLVTANGTEVWLNPGAGGVVVDKRPLLGSDVRLRPGAMMTDEQDLFEFYHDGSEWRVRRVGHIDSEGRGHYEESEDTETSDLILVKLAAPGLAPDNNHGQAYALTDGRNLYDLNGVLLERVPEGTMVLHINRVKESVAPTHVNVNIREPSMYNAYVDKDGNLVPQEGIWSLLQGMLGR